MKNFFSVMIGVMGFFILACLPAYAEPPEMYFGAGYGKYKFEFDNADTDFEDDSEVVRAFVGGNFNEAVGAELTYLGFGDVEDGEVDTDLKGWSLAGIFTAPVAEYFSVFGKVGWFAWDADISGSVGPIEVSQNIDGDDLFYGVGLNFGLGDAVDLRLEYDRYEIDDDIDPELDTVSVALQFVFD